MSKPKTISRVELLAALRAVADEAAESAQYNYDSLECLRLAAKEQVCLELAAQLSDDAGG